MSDPPPRWHRLRALAQLGAGLGRAPRAVLVLACLAIGFMYCTNHDMNNDPSPRGDGKYRPVLARGDGHMTYLMVRSLVFDGDLRFDNDLKRFGDPWPQPPTKAGRRGIPHPIGPVLIWAPLLAAAQGGAVIANQFGAGIQEHGYTLWHQRIVFASSVVFAWLAVGFGVWVFRRRFGGRWAPAYAAVAALLGTSLTFYATYMPSYGHAMDAATAGAFLATWALTLGDWRWRRLLLLGALLGLAALVRSQELGLGVVLAIEVIAAAIARPPDGATRARWIAGLVARGAATLGVALVVFTPQLYAWHVVYGSFTALPQGPHYTRPAYPMILEVLFAARNGWFSTTPLAYAGVLGLVVLAVRGPRIAPAARLIAIAMLAAVAVQVYLNSIIYDWWGNSSYGARRLCSMTVPIVIGLATWLHVLGAAVARWRRVPPAVWHAIAVIVLGWFVTWNLAWILPLRHGHSPDRHAGPICCKGVPGPLAALARPIYGAVGNPFAFPASAWFAVRHGVTLDTWDRVIGEYPFAPPMDYTRQSIIGLQADWDVGGNGMTPYIVDGLGPPVAGAGRTVRWTTGHSATVLIPVLVPERQRLRLLMIGARPHQPVVVRWHGDVVARAELDTTPTLVSWTIANDVGVFELAVSSDDRVALGVLRFTGV